jgi:branched-subunit amino acid transport protein
VTGYSTLELWTVIVVMGAGSYGLRFAFLGLFGRRKLPEWALRHLRYAPMAVVPALVAPLVLWPAATGGEPEPARLAATVATVAVGLATRNTLAAILGGAAALAVGLSLY